MAKLTKKQAVEQAVKIIEQETGLTIDKKAISDIEITPSEVSLKIGSKCLHFAYTVHSAVECGHFKFVSDNGLESTEAE